ncbi:MAG: hypothetical protein D4S02_16070, partial [Rhodocyclaceae bacterium]
MRPGLIHLAWMQSVGCCDDEEDMWQENVGDPGRSTSADADYRPSAKQFSFAGQVFGAERLLLERMLESIGNPSVQIELWDGQLVPQ